MGPPRSIAGPRQRQREGARGSPPEAPGDYEFDELMILMTT